MDLSVIWWGISSAPTVARLHIFFNQLTSRLFLPPSVHVILMFPLHALLSVHSLCRGCKMSPMIGSNPQRAPSYLGTFTICSLSAAESLAEDEQQRNATSYCSLISIYLSCSYRLCVHVWHSWWLHCVHCVVSSGNSGDGRIVPLTSRGKLSGGSKSPWLNAALSGCSLCVGLDCVLSAIGRKLTDC